VGLSEGYLWCGSGRVHLVWISEVRIRAPLVGVALLLVCSAHQVCGTQLLGQNKACMQAIDVIQLHSLVTLLA
jgi:hypothetical protein